MHAAGGWSRAGGVVVALDPGVTMSGPDGGCGPWGAPVSEIGADAVNHQGDEGPSDRLRELDHARYMPGSGFRGKFPQIRTLRSQVCKTAGFAPSAIQTTCRLPWQPKNLPAIMIARNAMICVQPPELRTRRSATPIRQVEITSDGQGAPVTLGYSESGHQPAGSTVPGAPCRVGRTSQRLLRAPQKPHNSVTRWQTPTGIPRTKRHIPVHLLCVLKGTENSR